MLSHFLTRWLLLTSLVLYALVPHQVQAQTQEVQEDYVGALRNPAWIPTGDIRRLFQQTVPGKELQGKSLREVLAILHGTLPQKAKGLEWVIDHQAFQQDPKDEPWDKVPLPFQPFPKKFISHVALRLAVSNAYPGATVWYRAGQVVITTRERLPAFIRQSSINVVQFHQRPLAEALDELAEWSGVSFLIDSRIARQAQKRVSARFHMVKVETAALLLADMAGLKTLLVDDVIYLTSPDNARDFQGKPAGGGFGALSGVAYKNHPVADIFKEFEAPRANFLVDPRVRSQTKARVTGKLINDVDMETWLRLLTDMCGLRHVVADNILYVTDPANAKRLEKELAPK